MTFPPEKNKKMHTSDQTLPVLHDETHNVVI